MTTSTSDRRRSLNLIVMLATVFLALELDRYFPNLEQEPIVQAVVILSAVGFYELVIRAIYLGINSSETLLRWYWGHLYLKGVWSYEYTLQEKVHFGVWEITQDVENFQVVGNGLDDEFQVRTIVRSVSPLVEEQGGYFVLNHRNELQNQNARVFSKTTLLLDHPRRPWGLVKSMRATTEVFGGPSDSQLHPNVVFRRHPGENTIEDVIEVLRTKYSESEG